MNVHFWIDHTLVNVPNMFLNAVANVKHQLSESELPQFVAPPRNAPNMHQKEGRHGL